MAVLRNFVVFEGCDGSGTSTQLELLRRRFDMPGMPTLACEFEPTDGHIGRLLRGALRGEVRFHAETMARLFAADRAEHLYGPGGIVELARRDRLVVCDRYTLSSRVYQGIDCGEALPLALNRDFPAPELLLLFDIDPRVAQGRIEKSRAGKDIYERLDFQLLVRERYLSLLDACREEGSAVVIIDANADIGEAAETVWQTISTLPLMARITDL
jgi:dTMP kinase